jgi:GAF domain-containing protein
MAKVAAESGTSFDPRVVGILQRRYVELEQIANEQSFSAPAKLSTDIKVERGLAPAAGFAESAEPLAIRRGSTGDSARVCAAGVQAQELFDLIQRPGAAFSLEDVFSLLSVRVKHLVPHDSMAVYVPKNDVLIPEFVSGENFRLFSSLRIPVGAGLSGWVAQNSKPILNGNPAVEPGYLSDRNKYSSLRSALAVPLEATSGVVAVLALYRVQPDGFTRDDLSVVQAMGSKLVMAIEHASQGCSKADSTAKRSARTSAAKAGGN